MLSSNSCTRRVKLSSGPRRINALAARPTMDWFESRKQKINGSTASVSFVPPRILMAAERNRPLLSGDD